MQFASIAREAADKAYTIVRNREATTITQNDVACYDMTTSFDGLWAQQADATDVLNMAGVADENIATNDYGRVQCWGYRASIAYSNEGTSITFTKGDWMGPISGLWGLTSVALTPAGVVAGESITVSATGYFQGFIRCI